MSDRKQIVLALLGVVGLVMMTNVVAWLMGVSGD